MSQSVAVRALGNRDVIEHEDTLRGLLLENVRINFADAEDPAALADTWYANLSRFVGDGSAVALGAFEGESLRGLVWAYRRDFAGRVRMHVGQIVVAEGVRSRGLGQRLLKEVENIARNDGIRTIELVMTIDNIAASRFYEANGFVAARVQMEKTL